MPLIALGAIAAVGSVAGGAIAAHGAGQAADAQVSAANQAAQLQHQDAQAALDVNKQQYAQNQANAAPFLKGGTSAFANLLYQMGVMPQGGGQGPIHGAPPAPVQSKLRGGFGGDTVSQFIPGVTPDVNGLSRDQRDALSIYRPGQAPAGSINSDRSMSGPRFMQSEMDANPTNGGEFTGNQGGQSFALDASGGPAPTPIDLNSQVNPALGGYGSLAQGWQGGEFKAPDNVTEQNDPGFQFRLAQGQKAIEQSAAARGGLLSGGTAKALNDYSQGQASNEYGNVYSRALGQYQQNYNQFQQQSTDKYNRLAALAGIGPQTAQQLGTLGNQSAGNATNIIMNSGGQIGQDLTNAGAGRAGGYINGANAWNGALGGLGNTASSLGLLQLLGKQGNGGAVNPWGSITF